MALSYVSIPEKDLNKGINQLASEDSLPAQYVEDAQDVDCLSSGLIAKRRGTALHLGVLPARVVATKSLTGQPPNSYMQELHLSTPLNDATGINLLTTTPSPIAIFGSMQNSAGAKVPTQAWYPDFVTKLRKPIPFGVSSTLVPSAESGLASQDALVQVVESVSATSSDNNYLFPDQLSIANTFDVTASFNNLGPATSSFVLTQEVPTQTGVGYCADIPAFSGTTTVLAATHQLNSRDLIIQVYKKVGLIYEELIPDAIAINLAGDIAITADTGGSNLRLVAYVADADFTRTGALQTTGQTTLNVTKPGDFGFVRVYIVLPGDVRSQVIPNSILFREDETEIEISFENSGGESYVIVASPAQLQTQVLYVDTLPYNGTSSLVEAELTLWGLMPEEYTTAGDGTAGWVTHLDSFVSNFGAGTATVKTLVAGMGKTFYTEAAPGVDFTIPLTMPTALRAATPAAVTLAPLFGPPTSSRTRGFFSFTGSDEGWADVLSINYVSGNSYIVTLRTPNLVTHGANFFQVNRDRLTLDGAEYSALNGSWPIQAIATGTNTLDITVTIASISEFGTDYNTLASGRAGGFTDNLPLSTPFPSFATGDTLSIQTFLSGYTLSVEATNLAMDGVIVGGVVEETAISAGQGVYGTHTGYCVPTSDSSFFVSRNYGPVRGMTLTYTGRPHPILLTSVFPTTATGTATVVGSLASLSLTVLTLPRAGQKLLATLGAITAEWEVLSVDGTLVTLSVPGVADGSYSFRIQPHIELAESISYEELFNASNKLSCEGVWLAIPPPDIEAVHTAVDKWHPHTLSANDWNNQPFVRSATAANNLYLSNGDDDVLAYDSFAIRRAGLYNWAPIAGIRVYADGAGGLLSGQTYRYYARLEVIDQNGTTHIAAVLQSNDYTITPAAQSSAVIRLNAVPNIQGYEYDRMFISLYRTEAASTTFYLVARTQVVQDGRPYYFVTDRLSDAIIKTQGPDDKVTNSVGLVNAPEIIYPPKAKYMTASSDRIILGNVKGYPTLAVSLTESASWTSFSAYAGGITLKRFSGATGSNDSFTYVPGQTSTPNFANSSVTFSGAGPTYTLTFGAAHGLLSNSWLYLHTPSANTSPTGLYRVVSAPTATTVTILAPGSTPTGTATAFYHSGSAGVSVPVPLFADGNFGVGINATAATDSKPSVVFRFAAMINASQSQLSSPIATATAGGDDTDSSRIALTQHYTTETNPTLTVSGPSSSQGIIVAASVEQPFIVDRFPSRVHFSAKNFPETHTTNYAVDINTDDGQEITGIIPFFSSSTTAQAQQESTIVVFKTNSIYLIKIDELVLVENRSPVVSVTKIESQGLGCTAPYSIAATKDGIMFANESGVYKLTKANSIEPVGRYVDRLWKEYYNSTTGLSLMHGHHYGVERTYKLSVPLLGSTTPSEALIYNHTNESQGELGAWTRYTNHNFVGWCNLLSTEYAATTTGRVLRNRAAISKYDYADSSGEAIAAKVLLRATDFGDSASRKRLLHLSVTFRLPKESGNNLSIVGTEVCVATNLSEDFQSCELYTSQGRLSQTGLNDAALLKGESYRYSVEAAKGKHFQVKIANSSLYEPLQFSGIIYRVAGLTSKGSTEAADTTGGKK